MKFTLLALLALFLTTACLSSAPKEKSMTVPRVDLDRFMGPWYVIAILPNFMEKHAVNGIETSSRGEGNKIAIEYRFRKNTPSGKEKIMHPKAFVYDTKTNSEWRVQFFWPMKFAYLVIDLAEDYHYTVIGVPNRKFVWIMARTPRLEVSEYQEILGRLAQKGYDTARIRPMPQVW
jgi:apolipoprotein D and lipocalin family protein